MIKLQQQQLFVYDHLNSRELSDNYLSDIQKNGQLFIIIEIPKNKNNTQANIDEIINRAAQYFKTSKQNNSELLLEEILQELNQFLPELNNNKRKSFLNDLDMIIGIINDDTVHISGTGNIYTLLIHNNKCTPLLVKDIKEKNKIFEDIISGELNEGDVLIASGSSLFDYISQEKIKQITTQYNPYNSGIEIKKLLETVPDFVSFNSLIIKKTGNSPQALKEEEKDWQEQNFFSDQEEEEIKEIEEEDEIENTVQKIIKEKPEREKRELSLPKTKWVIDFKAFKKIKFINSINNIINYIKEILIKLKKVILYIFNSLKNILTFITSPKYREDAEEKSIKEIKKKVDKKYLWFKALEKQKKIALLGLAITLLLFIQGLVFVLQNKSEKDNDEDYIKAINSVEVGLTEVKALLIYEDEQGAEDMLLAIQDIINNIEANNAIQKEEIELLKDSLRRQINEVRHINEVDSPLELFDLSSTLINPKQIVQKDGDFYVLDENKLYSLKDNLVNELIDFPQGITLASWPQKDKLILSNLNNYSIFDINTKSIESFPFNKTTGNTTIKDTVIYSNNLYVLDNINNQIFKYPEQGESFGSGLPWLQEERDLSQASSFTIDGNIYIINNGGEIEKYGKGLKENFSYHKPRPLINNNSIIKTFKNSLYLYIIDPDNNRIIILDKEGNIKDQFTSNKFNNLIDLAIDEEEKNIYLLNNNHLYVLPINE